MKEQSTKNKKAWEYRAYEFWIKKHGSPKELAEQLLVNPRAQLKKHKHFFEHVEGKKMANICGSNGRKAIPLALLGAEVTVFDISEENKKYAIELAENANTKIQYIVTDIYEIDLLEYEGYFDILYLEGGILHYFNNMDKFMSILFSLLKDGGEMVLSDFHPLGKCIVKTQDSQTPYQFEPRYFDKELREGNVAYKHYFDEKEQEDFPSVSIRSYTLSEIINSAITAGFIIKKFDEHRDWKNENIPWEFTILANK
ncbi:class I SAM-dependent methyltransferase [Sutcliffiella halmapala]|uniref:class I SAM-dependent methyltransferase n=1 Tax=Sutcliffiella halmapala TaxID=79882 RepID=UPI000994F8E1|nr:methyltransferase domain-containing protein [Sutcliffiella halmapala]